MSHYGDHLCPRRLTCPAICGRAYTLLEVLVSLFVIAILLGITASVVLAGRSRSFQVSCASNLVTVSHALQCYANDNEGWVPRDYGMRILTREPGWPVQLGKYLLARGEVDQGRLWEYTFFRCPSHPVERAATSYVINAFAFETSPDWRPSGPVRIGSIRKPSILPFLADCNDAFGAQDPDGFLLDPVYRGHNHDLWHPNHVRDLPYARLARRRHGPNINVAFLDGHVEWRNPDYFKLEDFDDGIRQRADKASW